MTVAGDTARWSTLPEGQFFERKSAFDRSSGRPKRRNAREVAWDIVETLSAMANADGGELVVGLEDNGDVTGVAHPADVIAHLAARV
jgi:ATP-dependent DNA helicase RecG